MIPFFSFEWALDYLKKTGCFWLKDEQFDFHRLVLLQNLLLKSPVVTEFLLSNIMIILYEADQIAWFDYKDKEVDPTLGPQPFLLPSDSGPHPFFQGRQSKLEDELLHLLLNYKWKKIILSQVSFVWCREKSALSTKFTRQLLTQLEKKQTKVNTLILEGPVYVNIRPFIQYINYNEQLEVLHYEIAAPALRDFQEWLDGYGEHGTLKKLILGNSDLNETTYQKIHHFLDQNYSIEEIDINKPKDKDLHYIWRKLKQRLALSPVDRFKAEKLNQASLLRLAEYFLCSTKISILDKLLRNSKKSATSAHEDIKNNEIDEQWPSVYQHYRHYFTVQDWLGQLDIQEKIEGESSLTVGAYLLHRVALTKEVCGTEFLLARGASPFAIVGGQSLLTQLLKEKKPSQWSTVILKYITQGGHSLAVCLTQKKDLWPIYLNLHALENHLTYYFCLLYQRMHYSFLTRFFTGIFFCLEARQEEIIQSFAVLAALIEMSDPQQEMNEATFSSLQDRLKQWVERAGQARCGLRGRSILNEGIQILGSKLEKSITKIRRQWFYKHKEYPRLSDQEEGRDQSVTNKMICLKFFV